MFPNGFRVLLTVGLLAVTASAGAHDRRYDQDWRGSAQRFRCESQDSRTAYCRVDTRYGVRLVDRLSRASCIPGRSWGWDRGGVWVTDGCRAEFVAGARWSGRDRDSGWDHDRDWDDDDYGYRDDRVDYGGYDRYDRGYGYVITCESRDGVYNFCRGGRGIREVRVQRQLSNAACRYNDSWGFRGDGIWVDRGCRAEFAVY